MNDDDPVEFKVYYILSPDAKIEDYLTHYVVAKHITLAISKTIQKLKIPVESIIKAERIW